MAKKAQVFDGRFLVKIESAYLARFREISIQEGYPSVSEYLRYWIRHAIQRKGPLPATTLRRRLHSEAVRQALANPPDLSQIPPPKGSEPAPSAPQ